eukprot:s1769_g2.t1
MLASKIRQSAQRKAAMLLDCKLHRTRALQRRLQRWTRCRKCEVNTIQRAGDKGSKSCGQVVEDPTSFGAPLICEPREPPKVPFCDALVDTTFSYEILRRSTA